MDKILPWSDLLPQIMPFTSCIIQVSCSAQGGGGGFWQTWPFIWSSVLCTPYSVLSKRRWRRRFSRQS